MIQKAQLDKLHANRIAKLEGKSPREVGREKALAAMKWIHRWGWSSPSLTSEAAGDNQAGLISRLVKRGYILKTRTGSGGGQKGVPSFMLTLTELGVQEVERHISDETELLPPMCDPSRINQALLRHDHLAQRKTLNALSDGTIDCFQTPREMREKSIAGVKEPDILWLLKGMKTGVEIELTSKWHRDMDTFVRSCIAAVAPEDGSTPRLDQIILLFDTETMLCRYKSALTPGAKYGDWERNKETRQWKKHERMLIVPESVMGKLICGLA